MNYITKLLIKYVFHVPKEIMVRLGEKDQKGSVMAVLYTSELWKKEKTKKKISSLLHLRWTPTENLVKEQADEVFRNDVFGKRDDYGDVLLELMAWHNCQDWDFTALLPFDQTRAEALEKLTTLTLLRYRKVSADSLHLKLLIHNSAMCLLVHPMVVKIPIISMQYFLHVHTSFAFNSIRQANHPQADDLVSYLYEILFLQQKIAISLHEYLTLAHYAQNEKGDSLIIKAEMNTILGADLVFAYLKASIEKIVALVGLTHGITNLDSKKTHKAKIETLLKELPQKVQQQYYCQFILEFIKSENLDELNNYRSGLLHKKGISELQPHNYVGAKEELIPFKKIFEILHDQHSKNTAILLGALALLTDDLVKRSPPTIGIHEIPIHIAPELLKQMGLD